MGMSSRGSHGGCYREALMDDVIERLSCRMYREALMDDVIVRLSWGCYREALM